MEPIIVDLFHLLAKRSIDFSYIAIIIIDLYHWHALLPLYFTFSVAELDLLACGSIIIDQFYLQTAKSTVQSAIEIVSRSI